jgi:hypothetical protein
MIRLKEASYSFWFCISISCLISITAISIYNKKHHIHKINLDSSSTKKNISKSLLCISSLIEEQYDGFQSSLKGLEYLNSLYEKIHANDFKLNKLNQTCRQTLNLYKKNKTARIITKEQQEEYLKIIRQTYSQQIFLQKIANKAINANLICKRTGGLELKIGFIKTLGLGWEHYSCRSPLGRGFHLFGPTFGSGFGFGVNVDLSFVDPIKFSLPLHITHFKDVKDSSQSAALIFGVGRTNDPSQQQKSLDVSLGLGAHLQNRKLLLIKTKKKTHFNKLYRLLKIEN